VRSGNLLLINAPSASGERRSTAVAAIASAGCKMFAAARLATVFRSAGFLASFGDVLMRDTKQHSSISHGQSGQLGMLNNLLHCTR
jgi:hypothetical protein